MKPELWLQVRSTFEAALELPLDDRRAFLDRVVGRDTEARAEVDRMLAAEPRTEGYLEPPSPETLETTGVVSAAQTVSLVGRQVGAYEIVRPLGHGGMGAVYEALQTSPRRTVALKVMRWSLVSKRAVRRFRYESELLARLQHPGIAQIYEAGVLREGDVETPWFAMEYVADAMPVVRYAARTGLDLENRLRLFLEVCDAVHHGHQRSVIHRDLKPGNILVDSEGRAKIIDFGIARATDTGGEHVRPVTHDDGFVGTPDYMSPEQVSGSAQPDVRSDVYSLGVVLYELLTETFPYEIAGKSLVEKGRIVCEQEPPRPSVHRPGLPRELDWIAQKAMAKDPEVRYGSVQELIADLRRLRADQPILAGPPTTGYYLAKFVRRHRLAVVAAALVLATLVAGMTTTAIFAWEAERRLQEFDYVANLVHLREVEAEAEELKPAWPDKIGAMLSWLEERAAPLRGRVPEFQAALDRLRRERALPAGPEEPASWPRQHPRFAEIEHLRRKLAALRTAKAVRAGEAPAETFDLVTDDYPADGERLEFLAHERTNPDRPPHAYGNEAEGLALARLAVSRLQEDGAGSRPLASAYDVLAWALHAGGLESEALAASDRAVELAAEDGPSRIFLSAERLRETVVEAVSGLGIAEIAAIESELRALEAEVAQHRQWKFRSEADQFLHNALADLVEGIERFEVTQVAAVLDRLNWAVRVMGSLETHAAMWEEARAAIRKADGVVASRLYRQQPIDLLPQPGLVPVGMNPVTGLWEFHHMASAKHPSLIPAHDPDGTIPVTEDSGIVFVLIPGGTFTMGARPTGSVNRDRFAVPDESPLTLVPLDPFFLAKTEVTQGQWKRLTGGERPSAFRPDREYEGRATPVDDRHPVESVSWFRGTEVLARFHLALPTEAQWEYSCRAGTDTVWFTGNNPLELTGYANLLIGRRVEGAYYGTLPAGSLRPNAFGLHDVHGNVNEWCRDTKLSYVVPHRPGDGLRSTDTDEPLRVLRGGSFQGLARRGRSAERNWALPGAARPNTGLRAARSLAFEVAAGAEWDTSFEQRVAATVPLRRVPLHEAMDPESTRGFDPTLKPITVGARIVPVTGNGVIAAQGGDHRGYSLYLEDWIPCLCFRDEGVVHVVRGAALTPNAAVHVAGVLDTDARLLLLVDGVEVASGAGAFLEREPVEALSIGCDFGTAVGDYRDGYDRWFRGEISSFRLYQGVLPPDDFRSWVASTR